VCCDERLFKFYDFGGKLNPNRNLCIILGGKSDIGPLEPLQDLIHHRNILTKKFLFTNALESCDFPTLESPTSTNFSPYRCMRISKGFENYRQIIKVPQYEIFSAPTGMIEQALPDLLFDEKLSEIICREGSVVDWRPAPKCYE
jgi:hypothetical protein